MQSTQAQKTKRKMRNLSENTRTHYSKATVNFQ
jgi:hypothetical protein